MIGAAVLLLAPAVVAVAVMCRRPSCLVVFLTTFVWAVVTVVVLLAVLLPVAFVSEGSLPPDDLADRLPSGVRIASQDTSCGSGGCARVYVLRDDLGGSLTASAERVEQAVTPGCRRRQWVPDLREHCTDVDIIDDRLVVHTYLQDF
ncbi:MAG: hypothetical protein U0Q15_06960 [Kineosporiaceae bacterium]